MPRPRPASRPRRRAARPVPADLVEIVAALPLPAVVTTGPWRDGGAAIALANGEFARLTGYSEAEAAAGNTRMLHGPRTDVGVLQQNLHGAQDEGEGWLHRKDGSVFYARWNFAALPGGHRLAIYHDFTDRKRMQDALVHAQKLETVGQLAGGMAHEFNNLLSIINGYCEILARRVAALPAAQREVQEVHRAGLKAATVARQILEFTRRTESEARVVNLNPLVREIEGIVRRALGDAITVELRLASDLGNARADPTAFQQALLNLCFNARDAMPGGGRLVIRTFNHRAAGPEPVAGAYVALEVTDTGLGMAEAESRRALEPFYTTKPHGTGLGLPLTQNFAREHGGHLSVHSTPGKGAAFTLYLPETPEAAAPTGVALPALPAARGSEKLLLIEGDEVLRKLVGGMLATDGYQVHAAAAMAEARTLVKKHDLRPDLLVADLRVAPVAALARRLREKAPGLRLLSVSAAPPPALAGFPADRVAHLPKPFALSALLRAVRALLDQPAGTRPG